MDQRSTPFFWNWWQHFQEEVGDEQPHFVTGDFGIFVCRQDPPTTPEDGELVWKTVIQVRLKDYIDTGLVICLIHYFYVKRGLFIAFGCRILGFRLYVRYFAPICQVTRNTT